MKKDGKKDTRLGLDIGTRFIKACEVSFDASTRKLLKLNLTAIDLPVTTENTAKALKTVLDTLRPSVKEANISLSAPSAIVRFVDMPKMKEDDLRKSLEFEAEKYIPFNVSEVIIDASIVEESSSDKGQIKVLLAAAKKTAVDSALAVLKRAGLTASLIDIDGFACFNAFLASLGEPDNSKSTVLLNIGYTHTNVVIMTGAKPFFTRDIRIGGKDIAALAAKSLEMKDVEVEKLIIDPNERGAEFFEIAKPVLGSLAEEIRLSFGYCENQSGRNINEIYISGGVSRMHGIVDYMEQALGTRPLLWKPFAKFEIADDIDKKSLEGREPYFAVSAGLAIRK